LPDGGGNPAADLPDDGMKASVNEVLCLLPERYRRVLMMKYVDMRSVREIARSDGQSEKAVESLLGRARAAFRERFRSACVESEGVGHEQ
jgi:DNA-directed RNA polymerase specialized sigma24 family protein